MECHCSALHHKVQDSILLQWKIPCVIATYMDGKQQVALLNQVVPCLSFSLLLEEHTTTLLEHQKSLLHHFFYSCPKPSHARTSHFDSYDEPYSKYPVSQQSQYNRVLVIQTCD